jgi:tellurite resistance protein TehA-like permease
MTATNSTTSTFEPCRWILWLTRAYVALFGIGTLVGIVAVLLGGRLFDLGLHGPDQLTPGWVLLPVPYAVFAIACVGVLLRHRDFAWVAVAAAWTITVIQCVQAFLQIFHPLLSLPLGAFVFAAYAIGLTRSLRPARPEARVELRF